ncbi:MAG: hypothetical protein IPH78_14300 [Bacteroidetes bacterium]|nr:hypothetical protein [Bacteroidota bacterium]MBK8659876.1 hypothetical protein [Bacteroidota bacterium]
MKKTLPFLLPLALLFIVASCTKEGPAGADGKDGNANVIVITHGPDTLSDSKLVLVQLPDSITPGMVDSSLILVYFKGSQVQACNFWYQSPGLGCGGSYQTRWVYRFEQNVVALEIRDVDGSSYSGVPQLVSAAKVVIAKGDAFFTGKKEADLSSYEAAKAYFGFKD